MKAKGPDKERGEGRVYSVSFIASASCRERIWGEVMWETLLETPLVLDMDYSMERPKSKLQEVCLQDRSAQASVHALHRKGPKFNPWHLQAGMGRDPA